MLYYDNNYNHGVLLLGCLRFFSFFSPRTLNHFLNVEKIALYGSALFPYLISLFMCIYLIVEAEMSFLCAQLHKSGLRLRLFQVSCRLLPTGLEAVMFSLLQAHGVLWAVLLTAW